VLEQRDEDKLGRPTGAYSRSSQTFFLDREGLGFLKSLFN